MADDIRVKLIADIAAFKAAMKDAAASLDELRAKGQATTAEYQAQSRAFTAAQAALVSASNQYKVMSASTTQAEKAIAAVDKIVGTTKGTIEGMGIEASFAGRKVSAMIDETLAGRWRQFDGTVASVIGRLASFNPVITAAVVALGGLAAAMGIVIYRAYEWQKALEAARGELVLMNQYTPESEQTLRNWVKAAGAFGTSSGDIAKMTEQLASLNSAAAPSALRLQDIALAQAQLVGGEAPAYLKKLVEEANRGGLAFLNYAHSAGMVDEAFYASHIAAAQAGNSQETLGATVEAVRSRILNQAKGIHEANEELKRYQQLTAEPGAGAYIEQPDPNKLKPSFQAGVPQDQQEATATVQKTNVAIQEQTKLWYELANAKRALEGAEAGTPAAEAAYEAVVTLQHKMETTHTESERIQYEATLSGLQQQLAAAKDNLGARESIEKQIASVTRAYEGENSNATRSALNQVANTAREISDQRFRFMVDGLHREQEEHKSNIRQQIDIEDQVLAAFVAAKRTETNEYQTELRRRIELVNEETKQEQAIAKINAETQIALGKETINAKRDELRAQVELYQISTQEELSQLKVLAEQEYALDLKSLEDKKRLAGEDVAIQAQVNGQILLLKQRLNAQLAALDRQATQATIKDWQSITGPIERAFTEMFTGIGNANQRQLSLTQRILQQMIRSFIEARIKIEFDWISGQIAMALGSGEWAKKSLLEWLLSIFGVSSAKKQANVADTTADAAAQATTRGIDVSSSFGKIMDAAAVAAANAFASTAAIPYVGPELAPEAAAAAYGIVAGYATGLGAGFEEGAWKTTGGIALIHPDEMIVPAGPAATLRSVLSGDSVANYSSGAVMGGDSYASHFYISAVDAGSVSRLLKSQGPTMAQQWADQVRRANGSLTKAARGNL